MQKLKTNEVIDLSAARKLKAFTLEIKNLGLDKLINKTKTIEAQIEKKVNENLVQKAKILLKELESRSSCSKELRSLRKNLKF